ncbi:MAG: Maf family protein [Pyrinomonadaceae bacterium]
MLDDKCSIIRLPKIILASGSPRRAEILNAVGWSFEKYVADIDESEIAGESPENYVQRLAQTKAETIAVKFPGQIVLGADTTVVIEHQIIGKPADLIEAKKMLEMLSGKWHEVLTGVALVKNENSSVGLQSTKVKFSEMSESEIEFLVEKGEPLDKAGAYAVQAQAALFIEKIEGDYWNVVGLPVNLVYNLYKQF